MNVPKHEFGEGRAPLAVEVLIIIQAGLVQAVETLNVDARKGVEPFISPKTWNTHVTWSTDATSWKKLVKRALESRHSTQKALSDLDGKTFIAVAKMNMEACGVINESIESRLPEGLMKQLEEGIELLAP